MANLSQYFFKSQESLATVIDIDDDPGDDEPDPEQAHKVQAADDDGEAAPADDGENQDVVTKENVDSLRGMEETQI